MGITHVDGLEVAGVPTMGVNPLPLTTDGTYFFVSSTTGSNSFAGTSADAPFATLAYALSSDGGGLMVANRGDTIVIAPGHAESIIAAGTVTCDVAGVNIIGLGTGADRPEFTFSTATTASLLVTAANVQIANIVCISGIDALVNPLHIQAAGCTLGNYANGLVEWQDPSSSLQAVRAVLTTTAANNLNVNMKIVGITSGGTAPVNGIRLVGCDNGIVNCDFYGRASTAYVEFLTTACTNIEVYGYMYNSGTTDGSKNVVDTATASTWFAEINDGAAGSSFSGGSGASLAADDITPVVNALYGASGIATYPAAAAPANAVSIAEVLAATYYGSNATNYNAKNYLAVTADLSSATWNSSSSNGHEVFTVTGSVRIRILPIATTGPTAVASSVISLGTSGSHAAFIANTSTSGIDTNEAWLTTTPAAQYAYSSLVDRIVVGEDIGYDISTAPATAGAIVFHAWWEPLNSTGAVAAGTGGTMA